MAKFTVTFKDPDYSTAGDHLDAKVEATLKAKFVEWDEYITVEFDTTHGTARVVPVKENLCPR